MDRVGVNLLKAGMVFSEPVYIDDTNLFVLAGVPLRQKDLDKLKSWDIETVQTDGFPYPNKEEYVQEVAQKVNSALSLVEVQQNRSIYRNYTSLIEQMNMVFLRINAGDNASADIAINTISSQLFQVLENQRDRFVGFILGGEVKGNEMAKSSVNTAILSALIAQELKFPRYKIFNVIIGALLHDIGMLRLPKYIIDKQGGLSEKEQQQMHSHPLYGHKIATKELSYADEVGDIVLQHHERWDGNGYPEKLAGNSINIGARIVSITDAFEAMISEKPYRNSMVGYQAMINLLADSSHRFDPIILKALVLIMGIYPIGSFVSLNNGIIARVMEVRADAPLRPKIRVIIDEFKKIHKNEKGALIDLLIDKDLYITEAIDGKELSVQYA